MDIYGVIGWPIKHTLSPLMHNAAFKKLGIDAEYQAFEIKPENLKEFIEKASERGIRGLNITVPHKETCMAFLDSIDPLADSIGAVNTIVIKDARLNGFNTDAQGFITALREGLGFEAKGKSVFIIGSGGASRAVSFGLAENGAGKIVITDLFSEKAASLAENIKRRYPLCKVCVLNSKKLYIKEDLNGADLLVNATPIGLKEDDPFLFDESIFRKGLFVYDLVYNPEKTRLVELARKKGLKASGGLGMLLYQGAKSFELWTGKKAPIGVMRETLKSSLKGITNATN